MSHKFRFSKDSRERLNSFATGEKAEERSEAADSAPETAAADKKAVATEPAALTEEAKETAAESGNETQKVGVGLTVVSRTDIGKVRRSNQDATIIAGAERLYGVADGMGGHNGGETASSEARDGLISLLRGKEADLAGLRTAIGAVNRRLFLRQKEDESLSGMGTTLTVLWFSPDRVYLGHVGDSRAYRLRDGQLTQITEDHSVVAELVRNGMLTPEQAANHPMRNVITRAVGTEEGVEADMLSEERRKGDVWLICSDGLYGMIGDQAIEKILKENEPEKAADLLIAGALDAGGRDNVTLVLIRDEEGAA